MRKETTFVMIFRFILPRIAEQVPNAAEYNEMSPTSCLISCHYLHEPKKGDLSLDFNITCDGVIDMYLTIITGP